MIVLQLTSDYIPDPLWGMGWHVKFLTQALRKKDITVYVGTSSKSKDVDKMTLTTSPDIDKSYLSNQSYEIFNNFEDFLTWQKCLGREIIKRGIIPNIIHCHNWMSWLTAVEIKKKYPKSKIVSTIHLLQKQYDTMIENPIPSHHEEIIKIENEMLLNSDYIILQSYPQLEMIESKYTGLKDHTKIRIIPSGVDFNPKTFEEVYHKKIANPFIDMVFVGRIERDKGIYQTLEAFSILSKRYKNIRLHVLGRGSKLLELSNKFISKNIIFHGFVDRNLLKEILEKSFIFCLPSSSESFGNSVIEAMTYGVVPIFSKGENIPILFKEDFHGLNVPLKLKNGKYSVDTRDIVQKMEILINDKKLLNKFSLRAYNFSKVTYSIDAMTEKILNVYTEIL
ncbi:MAG: glycosyltransferase family 4 protein [Nanoarchaeota archaeon]|nr:glycosyltransferase family 4 protein [Nanoarchaeota archaeon]